MTNGRLAALREIKNLGQDVWEHYKEAARLFSLPGEQYPNANSFVFAHPSTGWAIGYEGRVPYERIANAGSRVSVLIGNRRVFGELAYLNGTHGIVAAETPLVSLGTSRFGELYLLRPVAAIKVPSDSVTIVTEQTIEARLAHAKELRDFVEAIRGQQSS